MSLASTLQMAQPWSDPETCSSPKVSRPTLTSLAIGPGTIAGTRSAPRPLALAPVPAHSFHGHNGIPECMANLSELVGVHFEPTSLDTSGDTISSEPASPDRANLTCSAWRGGVSATPSRHVLRAELGIPFAPPICGTSRLFGRLAGERLVRVRFSDHRPLEQPVAQQPGVAGAAAVEA